MKTTRLKRAWALILVGLIGVVTMPSCEKENPFADQKRKLTKEGIYDIMAEWYFWLDALPPKSSLDFNAYESNQDLLDDLINDPTDRFSYIMDTEEFLSLFQKGEYVGHGFGWIFDGSNNALITYVFRSSPMYDAGVRRGWKILEINGTVPTPENANELFGPSEAGVQNQFLFQDTGGGTRTLTFSKQEIQINTVLNSVILDTTGYKVGYFAFESFLETSFEELNTVFQQFSSQGIDELVIDLRYNGGGLMSVADSLASLIAGNIANKSAFVKYFYNEKKSKQLNAELRFQPLPYTITISRIFFLTSSGTASASEALINGLKPFLDIQIIGDDTFGKPVGALNFSYDDYSLLPIVFKLANKNNETDYFDGLPADIKVSDDLGHLLGDPDEAMFSQALHYIINGSYAARKKSFIPFRNPAVEKGGFYHERGAY